MRYVEVLIVAKCIVNGIVTDGDVEMRVSINSSKVYCKWLYYIKKR